MTKVVLMVGTKKGAFLFTSDARRTDWQVGGPFFKGTPVYHMNYAPESGVMLATVNDVFFGPQVHRSLDLGQTWQEASTHPRFAPDAGLAVERLWHIAPARNPGNGHEAIYLGVEPAALFRSLDAGDTWDEVPSLTNHATRDKWFPAGGGLCLHTILQDPADSMRLYVGASAAGLFRSDDGGASWQPMNRGVLADFIPEPDPLVGHCVHKAVLDPCRPDTIYQQNHCGVYRSDDRGETWRTIEDGLPANFGFAMAAHQRDPQTLFVVPDDTSMRVAPDAAFAVYRSRDGGASWQPLRAGLPQENAWLGVLREGLTVDATERPGVYAGTKTGQLFASADEGDSWRLLAGWLPPIHSVSCVTLEG